jgi:hypothetical protein
MDIEEGTKKKIKHIGMDRFIKTISGKTGLPTEDVGAVFDAIKHELPKMVKKYSPAKVGDITVFTIPHFQLEVKCIPHKTSGTTLIATPVFVKN